MSRKFYCKLCIGNTKLNNETSRIKENKITNIVNSQNEKFFLKGTKRVVKEFLETYKLQEKEIYQSIIEIAKNLKVQLVKESKYPNLVPIVLHRQTKLISHKGYYEKTEKGFNSILNNKNFEALIYKIRCDLPNSPYDRKIYIGLTGRNLKTRFREHIIEAIRQCFRTNNTPGVGYTKLYRAIANSLIHVGWDIERLYEDMRSITGQQYHILLEKVINSIKNKHIFPEIIEVHEYMDTAHEREKCYTKTLDTVKNGLNEYEGGGYKGKHVRLPLYDIALMIALGKNLKQITDLLNDLYNFDVSKGTVSRRILDFFGGWYEAQVKFFKPVIERLFSEGYDGYEIYRTFEEIAGQHQATWFNDWRWGETFLDFEIERAKDVLNKKGINNPSTQEIRDTIDYRYFGILKSQWIKWAIEDVSFNVLKKMFKFSKRTLVEIYKKIGGSQPEVQKKYRKSLAIDLIKNSGWTIEKIYTDAFKRAPNTPPKRIRTLAREYFENALFPNLSLEEIYMKYNKSLLVEYLRFKEETRPKPSKRMEDMKNYPKDLEGPFSQELSEGSYFSLRGNKIHNFPKFLRYMMVGFIYGTLKEQPSISKETLLHKIIIYCETQNFKEFNEAIKSPKFSQPIKDYLVILMKLISEIKGRIESSESISRSAIIKSFKKKGLELQVSPPIINDIIWTIKNLFPDEFK